MRSNVFFEAIQASHVSSKSVLDTVGDSLEIKTKDFNFTRIVTKINQSGSCPVWTLFPKKIAPLKDQVGFHRNLSLLRSGNCIRLLFFFNSNVSMIITLPVSVIGFDEQIHVCPSPQIPYC